MRLLSVYSIYPQCSWFLRSSSFLSFHVQVYVQIEQLRSLFEHLQFYILNSFAVCSQDCQHHCNLAGFPFENKESEEIITSVYHKFYKNWMKRIMQILWYKVSATNTKKFQLLFSDIFTFYSCEPLCTTFSLKLLFLYSCFWIFFPTVLFFCYSPFFTQFTSQ